MASDGRNGKMKNDDPKFCVNKKAEPKIHQGHMQTLVHRHNTNTRDEMEWNGTNASKRSNLVPQ